MAALVAGRPRTASSNACAPGDEVVGEYSRDRLLRMDEKFCAAMERAIARGLERRADGEAPEREA